MINHRADMTILGELERDEHVSSRWPCWTQQRGFATSSVGTSGAHEPALVGQAELARRIGTSQPAIARLEAGLADPKLSTIARYAAALGFELHFNWQRVRGPVANSRESVSFAGDSRARELLPPVVEARYRGMVIS